MIIQLTRGYVTHVDDEDYDMLMHFTWHVITPSGKPYAYGRVFGEDTYMHRFLMGEPKGIEIDHRDHDGLNNRRRNLRFAAHHQNLSYRGCNSNNTSGFKGVHKHDSGLWKATIWCLGSAHSVYSKTREEAARHYNKMAVKYHGEFALLNDVTPIFPTVTGRFGERHF